MSVRLDTRLHAAVEETVTEATEAIAMMITDTDDRRINATKSST